MPALLMSTLNAGPVIRIVLPVVLMTISRTYSHVDPPIGN
jgi:hypothetical protein